MPNLKLRDPQVKDRDSSWFGPPPAAAKADRFSVTREKEEGTRMPYLQDVSEVSDAALCRAGRVFGGTRAKRGRNTLALSTGCIRSSNWSRTYNVQDRMPQGLGIVTGLQEARKRKNTMLGTADNFHSLLSSGLSSSRLTTVQGNCAARWAPRRPGYGSLSVSDQHAHLLECNSAVGASARSNAPSHSKARSRLGMVMVFETGLLYEGDQWRLTGVNQGAGLHRCIYKVAFRLPCCEGFTPTGTWKADCQTLVEVMP